MSQTTLQRMNERDRRVLVLLAQAGFRNPTELHRAVEDANPGLCERVTVRRYLYAPPERRDYRVLQAIAGALEISVDELEAAIATDPGDLATAR